MNMPGFTAEAALYKALGHYQYESNYIDKLAYSEVNWNGDTANMRIVAFGQTVTAQLYVMNDALRVEVQLPWILSALTGKIQSVLKTSAQESLRIGHTPPKT